MPTPPNVSALARKFALDIDTTPASTPTWTAVKGTAEFKPAMSPNLEDDSTYDDEGWGGSTKTGLTWSIEGKLVRKYGSDDVTAYDAGQEQMRSQAELFGSDGVAHVRWYDRFGGPEAYEGYAEVTWSPDGGKRTDLETVSYTLTGKGERLSITNPLAEPTPAPVVSGLSVAAGAAAGGTQTVLTGEHFIGVTGVKFGTTDATQFVVVSPTQLVAVSPAHTGATINVTVINGAGTSPTGAANQFVYS